MSPADQGDNNATFLAEFRALRDHAGLDYAELAARAHYPTDVLMDAETGPSLPGLPVLVAYVRACDADPAEWEERWRLLAAEDTSPLIADVEQDDSGLPVRPPGASPAAMAGARAGVTVAPADMHDPERIKAALRAHRTREETAAPGHDPAPVNGWATGGGTASTMLANGHHQWPGLDTADAHTSTSSADYAAPASSDPSSTSDYSATSWTTAPPESVVPPEFAPSPEPTAPPDFTRSPASAAPPEFAESAEFVVLPESAAFADASHSPAAEPGVNDAPSPRGDSMPSGHGRRSATRAGRTFVNTRFMIVGIVLIVLIGCILLLTLA
jgi:hypothetical protein